MLGNRLRVFGTRRSVSGTTFDKGSRRVLPLAVQILCVIPARLGSHRLPRKPLRLLAGEPLVRHVARRALESAIADHVVVATDDPSIVDAVAPLPVQAMLTDSAHGCGTERVADVAARPGFGEAEIVLNVQGDEPFFPVQAARDAVREVERGRHVGTVGARLEPEDLLDSHRVKVVVGGNGLALRFARTLPASLAWQCDVAVRRHVGIYAYSRDALARWAATHPTPAERAEGLEQLRPLRLGMSIGVVSYDASAPPAVDTADDLSAAERYMTLSTLGAG